MEAASSAPVSGLGLTLAVLITSVALVLGLGWAARRLRVLFTIFRSDPLRKAQRHSSP